MMNRSWRRAPGMWIAAVALVLTLVAAGSLPGGDKADTTPAGLTGVELFDLPWLAGDWVGPRNNQVWSMAREGRGIYKFVPSDPEGMFKIAIFRNGCERMAEIHMYGGTYVYARLSGHNQRLSFDMLPSTFPAGWRDRSLLADFGLDEVSAVPSEKRAALLVHLASRIDEIGTLLHQDMTYFRPGWND